MRKTIGIVEVAAFAGECRDAATGRRDHGDLTANQIGRQTRQSIVLVLCPAIFDRHILPFHVADFPEALVEAREEMREKTCGLSVE